MLNETGQALSVITGTNSPGVNSFFHNNNKRLEKFKKNFTSKEQQSRERLAAKNAARSDEAYEVNKMKYMRDDGYSENEASVMAGIDQFGHTVRSLLQNPGRILDATVESLPYMLGVGAAGRVATGKAAQYLGKKALDKEIKRVAGKEVSEAAIKKNAARATDILLDSKAGQAFLNKVSTATGVGTVAITEGLSVSAGVYDRIANMSEKEAMQSGTYRELRKQGMSHSEAATKMGEDAFNNVILPMMAVAGTISKVTGAAGIESRLFTNFNKLAKDAAKTSDKYLTGKVGKAVKGTAKFAASGTRPGTREAIEESVQSGGGEFLSQLASFDATGEEVGPGIGSATAEGALVGFASGAGIVKTADALKAFGNMDTRKFLKAGKEYAGKTRTEAPTAYKGTSTIVRENVDKQQKSTNYSPSTSFDEAFAKAGEDGSNIGAYIHEMHLHREEANKSDTPLSDKQEQAYQGAKEAYVSHLANSMDTFSNKPFKNGMMVKEKQH